MEKKEINSPLSKIALKKYNLNDLTESFPLKQSMIKKHSSLADLASTMIIMILLKKRDWAFTSLLFQNR